MSPSARSLLQTIAFASRVRRPIARAHDVVVCSFREHLLLPFFEWPGGQCRRDIDFNFRDVYRCVAFQSRV